MQLLFPCYCSTASVSEDFHLLLDDLTAQVYVYLHLFYSCRVHIYCGYPFTLITISTKSLVLNELLHEWLISFLIKPLFTTIGVAISIKIPFALDLDSYK